MFTEVFHPPASRSVGPLLPGLEPLAIAGVDQIGLPEPAATAFESDSSTWTVSQSESDTKRLAAVGFQQPKADAKVAAKLAQVDARFVRLTDDEVQTLRKALPARRMAESYLGPLPSAEALAIIEAASDARFAPKRPSIPPYGTPMAFPNDPTVSLSKSTAGTLSKKHKLPKEPRLMFDELWYWYHPANKDELGTWAIGICTVKDKRYYYKLARWGESLAGSLESYKASMEVVQEALDHKYQRRRAVVAALFTVAIALIALGLFSVIPGIFMYLAVPIFASAVILVPGKRDYEL